MQWSKYTALSPPYVPKSDLVHWLTRRPDVEAKSCHPEANLAAVGHGGGRSNGHDLGHKPWMGRGSRAGGVMSSRQPVKELSVNSKDEQEDNNQPLTMRQR